MSVSAVPGLFGLRRSNRDFSRPDNWGKNQFNSSFPAALACYMEAQGRGTVFLHLQQGEFERRVTSFTSLLGISPNAENCFFAFEAPFTPYQTYIEGRLPRTDLVLQDMVTGQAFCGLEVKLTALPDHVTSTLDETHYGSELVVRPDSIVYLACSLARNLDKQLAAIFAQWSLEQLTDWQNAAQVLPYWPQIVQTLQQVVHQSEDKQSSFLLQPIWKTEGKSPRLAEHCLDSFIWSDSAFLYFMLQLGGAATPLTLNRYGRSLVWTFLLLLHIAKTGRVSHHYIIDLYSFNTKNDKAFAANGRQTNKFMLCPRLVTPSIEKSEIQNIILGGGQHFLSPERRFDAVLVNDPTLFPAEAK